MSSSLLDSLIQYITLASSISTLICCALPALLVTLGMGASLVGVIQVFPQLVFLSEQKLWIFSGAGLMLSANGYDLFKAKHLCPVDPVLGRVCQRAKKWSWAIWIVSVLLFALGGFVTFLVPLFFF